MENIENIENEINACEKSLKTAKNKTHKNNIKSMLEWLKEKKEKLEKNKPIKFEPYTTNEEIEQAYKNWLENLVFDETIRVNRELCRNLIKFPDNSVGVYDTHIPYSCFEKVTSNVNIDLQVRDTPENHELIAKYGGKLIDVYNSEGYLTPFFYEHNIEDQDLRNSYMFILFEKPRLLLEF